LAAAAHQVRQDLSGVAVGDRSLNPVLFDVELG
jgi:hypothetical protein